ncbi:MAG: hypothetical protein LBO72_10755 [Helicobacteraceae bacterium]|nr:hypothetical protein [Helicobacteraceae bacterium]
MPHRLCPSCGAK